MGAETGTAIALSVEEVLSDASNVVWTEAQLLEWLNDAQYAISLVRPDASSSVVNLLLVAGTKQTIAGRRLIDVIRNMGADGNTAGQVVEHVDMGNKDKFNPSWHSDSASITINDFMHDPRVPTVFYVSPPATAPTYLELKQAVVPAVLTALTETINLDDVYVPVIIEWMLYRSFSRDDIDTPNFQRGQAHKATFFNLLGVKTQIDQAFTPQSTEEVT